MTITYRFIYEDIEVEVEADPDVDNTLEIEKALNTIDELSDLRDLDGLQSPHASSNVVEASVSSSTPDSEHSEGVSETSAENSELPPACLEFARGAGLSPHQFSSLLDVDAEQNDPPFVLAEKELLGDSRRERQLNASLLILGVWSECYIDRQSDWMEVSTLKDALQYSNVDPEKLYSMYTMNEADAFFDREGRGGNAKIKISRRGIRQARKIAGQLGLEQGENNTA